MCLVVMCNCVYCGHRITEFCWCGPDLFLSVYTSPVITPQCACTTQVYAIHWATPSKYSAHAASYIHNVQPSASRTEAPAPNQQYLCCFYNLLLQGWRQTAPWGHSPSISSFVPLNMLPRGYFDPQIHSMRHVVGTILGGWLSPSNKLISGAVALTVYIKAAALLAPVDVSRVYGTIACCGSCGYVAGCVVV